MEPPQAGLHGVGLNDLHLLCALDEAADRRLRRVDLARALGLTPSGVTWIFRPLIKRGLVASEPSPDDERVALALLTSAGQRLVAHARRIGRRHDDVSCEAEPHATSLRCSVLTSPKRVLPALSSGDAPTAGMFGCLPDHLLVAPREVGVVDLPKRQRQFGQVRLGPRV